MSATLTSEETWTAEDVLAAASKIVEGTCKCSLSDFVKDAREGRVDRCEFAEVLALLKLLPESNEYRVG